MGEQVNLDDLTDEQILNLNNELTATVEKLELETVMFERYEIPGTMRV